MDNFFICNGYQINPVPMPWKRRERIELPQWHAYRVANIFGGKVIADIGCGDGMMATIMFEGIKIIGFDTVENIEYCRKTYPQHDWISCDLEIISGYCLPQHIDTMICADVIEHLVNPRPLLNMLACEALRGTKVVISTPERHLKHGYGNLGPPTNKNHVREWSLSEFHHLLKSYGLDPFLEIVPPRKNSEHISTILAVI